jgi:hypothetical protein
VEDLEVLEQRVGRLDAGSPAPVVEQLGLHSPPKRLDQQTSAVLMLPDGTMYGLRTVNASTTQRCPARPGVTGRPYGPVSVIVRASPDRWSRR